MTAKDKVLEALEKNKGNYLSGEQLAREIGVSRNAVWKAVSDLKRAGYDIEAVTNRGYMMAENTDILSLAGIGKYLKDSELLSRFLIYDSLDSTNREAERLLAMHGEPAVLIAKKQTEGQGHTLAGFPSPEGGIYMSLIVKPDNPERKMIKKHIQQSVIQAILTVTGKKVRAAADSSLYDGETKVAGILTECLSDLETGRIRSLIIGIGVRFDLLLPKEHPTDVNKNRLVAEIINQLSHKIEKQVDK